MNWKENALTALTANHKVIVSSHRHYCNIDKNWSPLNKVYSVAFLLFCWWAS